jgi:alpha-beta hydrolase superfamily lysophospholipase
LPYETLRFQNGDVVLHGWLFRARPPRRGLIVYLHGIADNRQSAIGFAERLVPRGFDVLAYDSRAHGESTGDACTYGYHEKDDLSRALDAVGAREAVLFGASLGGAVALQAAAQDARVKGVVAVSSFADLSSIVRYRAPWFLTARDVSGSLGAAGRMGGFPPEAASPERAASRVHVPVLLLHGELDRETPPDHSRRIFRALGGPRDLRIIKGATHNDVLAHPESWRAIDGWLDGLFDGA